MTGADWLGAAGAVSVGTLFFVMGIRWILDPQRLETFALNLH